MTLPDLARYDAAGIDTETTGTSYRDRAVGISLYLPDGKQHYLRWGHEAGGNNCTRREMQRWANTELRGMFLRWFNAPFDTRMLAYDDVWLYDDASDARYLDDAGVAAPLLNELEGCFKLDVLATNYANQPKLNDDVLNQWCADQFGGRPTTKAQIGNYWRAPGNMVEPYAMQDAKSTWFLHEHYHQRLIDEGLYDLYRLECELIPMLLKMHITGVRVDRTVAESLRQDILGRFKLKEHEWLTVHAQDGSERFIDSAQRFLPIWERHGLPVTRLDPTPKMKEQGKPGNPSFSAKVLEHIDHPIAGLIRELRRLKHYSGTFIENYIINNADPFGMVHGEFHSVRNDRYGTVSGRFSSGGELNLQNIPARDLEWAPLIRGLFIPLPGYRWGKIDYSQIEYRFFAHYCGGRLEQVYIDEPFTDFHQMMAELTGHPRKHAKNINFCALYGGGIGKIAEMMGCTLDEARTVYDEYHHRAPEVKDLSNKAQNRAKKRGYVFSWGGRMHRFPRHSASRYAQVHKALNRLCQGSAADLIKFAMRRVDQIIDWEHVICHLTVHDELDFSVAPTPEGMKMFAEVRDAMENINDLGGPRPVRVPIIADASLGPDWGHCSEPLSRAA